MFLCSFRKTFVKLFFSTLIGWGGAALAQTGTTIDIQCTGGQLTVTYNLASGDTCTGERVVNINNQVRRATLRFDALRNAQPRITRNLNSGDLMTVNGFLSCRNQNTGQAGNISRAAASQTGCSGGEVQTPELFNTVASALANQQGQNNQNTTNRLEAANGEEFRLCSQNVNSAECEEARRASQALRNELGIQ